jgi:transcriptional regulator with XRE-family HTH domain
MNATRHPVPLPPRAFRLRGNRVRALLGRRNLTLTEGAERLGVSRSYFSQLLAGRRALSPKVRRRLLANAPFSELSADELWLAPPDEPDEEVARAS